MKGYRTPSRFRTKARLKGIKLKAQVVKSKLPQGKKGK